jgi:outer membrane cobalamin receptor
MQVFKHLSIMLLLLVATRLCAQTGVLDAPLTLKFEDKPLVEVLTLIEQSHPITFSYDNRILPEKQLEGEFKGLPLREGLDQLLRPLELEWALKGNIVILTQAKPVVKELPFHVISGYVEDAQTGERLVGAQVVDWVSRNGVLTNDAGFFSLRLRQDSVKLVVSMLGYAVHGERFMLRRDERRQFKLASDLSLETVVITDENQPTEMEEAGVSVVQVPMAELEKLPALMGESDVINLLKMMPGVHSGGDGATGFYVRGGGPDQNLVLLDGATVYNSSHLFGFYSIFNSDAIKDVKLVKGGFPARYGGRLSSVVDIQAKDGNLQNLEGGVHLGLVSAKVMLTGPIIKDKTSFLISARRTILEPFFAIINEVSLPQQGNRLGYSFIDLQGKLQHILGPKDRLLLGAYVGGDRFASGYAIADPGMSNEFDFGLKWGNKVGSLQWRHEWNSQLFSHFYLLGSQYTYNAESASRLHFSGSNADKNALQIQSAVRDWGARWSFDLLPDCHQWLRFGVAGTRHRFEPETFTQLVEGQANDTAITALSQKQIQTWESMAWVEDQVKVGDRLNFNLGLHFSNYWVDSSFYWSIQPRGSARLSLPSNFGVQASYTEMVQYIHLLTNSGLGLPTDLWVPATGAIPPQRSRQVSLGMDKKILNGGWSFSIEAYYKEMRDLIEYQTGVNFLGNTQWQDLVEKGGTGLSRGLEFLVRKSKGRLTGWLGYTLSKTDRQFTGINFGESFPYKYDRRHDLSTALIFNVNDRMDLSANWMYATGNAITFPEGVYYGPSAPLLGFWDLNQGDDLDVIIDYGDRNSYRLPAYHRLDVNLRIHRKLKWGETYWNFGIFNVYNRRNPYFLFLRADYSEDPNTPAIKVRRMSLLPILPEFSFGFKF